MEPLVLCPGTERELEFYYRAHVLLLPGYDLGDLSSGRVRVADRCSNERLKMVLFSMTSSEKATTVLLGILQGPQRSSLTLHSAVWKALVNAAIPIVPRHDSAVLELELEFMKIIAIPLRTCESGEVTTIDKPTDEMRGYILDKFLPLWNLSFAFPFDLSLDQCIIFAFLCRIQERLCHSVHASDRKQLIKTSLTIIECTSHCIHTLAQEKWRMYIHLYSFLSSKAFVVVSPDLQPLVCKTFIILDNYRSRVKPIPADIHFYSIAYQCYLHSPVGGDERSKNDVMPCALGRLISSSLNLPPALSMDDSESHETPFNPLHYPLFSINGLFQVMLLLIKEQHENVLYEWARHPAMQNVWPECLMRLVQWASGEEFRQWDLLKHVLAVVVIGELQNMLDHSDDNESLPQYDFDVSKDVDQLPWLYEIPGSSHDGEPNALKYSQIAKHPKFQEFLHSHLPSQEDAVNE